MSFDRILVPLDGSPLAEAALPKARALAGAHATVTLLRAAEARTFPGVDPTEAQISAVEEAEGYLARVLDQLRQDGFANAETTVWYGPAAAAIVEAAHMRKFDLIVMTTHGRSGLGRLIMGSVAESVLRGTTTPILLVRAETAPIEPPGAPAGARPMPAARA